jgi:hypothetical protein
MDHAAAFGRNMALYELSKNAITALDRPSFSSQGIGERSDLQRLLKYNIKVVAPDEPLLVIGEEFCDWDGSKRRIDLLALDQEANLVVIELKRTDDGGHMELQAIRYAAMVSTMTFSKAAEVFAEYLEHNNSAEDAQAKLLEFLSWQDVNERPFGQHVRIILVSAEFSKEITTSVLWLNERDLDIRCVRIRPYMLNGRMILDVQQIIPLPEAASYIVQIKHKAEESRLARIQDRDFSKYDLTVDGHLLSNLNKRHFALEVVKAALAHGISPAEVFGPMPSRNWLEVDGEVPADEFKRKALESKDGRALDLERYFCGDDELFRIAGRTYALTRMWGKPNISIVHALISKFPPGVIECTHTEDDPA